MRDPDDPQGLVPFIASQWDMNLVPGESERVEIQLTEGILLAGRVVDANGSPLDGAWVQVEAPRSSGPFHLMARSTENGTFELCGMPPSTTGLSARRDGYRSAVLRGADLGSGLERRGLELVLKEVPSPDSGAHDDAGESDVPRVGLRGDPGGTTDRRVVRGVVALPEGTPDDERAEVFLEVIESGSGEGWVQTPRVPVAPDGSFAIEVPGDFDGARLWVEGRYVYLGEPVRVPEEPRGEPIRIEALLGSHVTFLLVPPPRSRHDAKQLVGRTVVLRHSWRGGGPMLWGFRRECVVAEDLTFEAGGLSPGKTTWIAEGDDGLAGVNASYAGLAPFVVGEWKDWFGQGIAMDVEIPLLDPDADRGGSGDDR